jgi:hypothetical protein
MSPASPGSPPDKYPGRCFQRNDPPSIIPTTEYSVLVEYFSACLELLGRFKLGAFLNQ